MATPLVALVEASMRANLSMFIMALKRAEMMLVGEAKKEKKK